MGKEDEIELKKSETTSLTSEEKLNEVEVIHPRRGFLNTLLNICAKDYVEKFQISYKEAYDKAIQIFEEDLKNKGLTGEHELLAPANVERGLWANLDGEWKLKGFMFLILGNVKGSGKLKGNARTVSSVQFAWKPNEKDILVTEIPVDKLAFREDPSTKIPRVSFIFNTKEFIKISYSFITARSFPYPNDYLMGERLSRATLTTSSLKDLKGLPLPRRKNS